MRSIDNARSAADLRRLRHVTEIFDYVEAVTQLPQGAKRKEIASDVIREATQLSVEDRISRQERDAIVAILAPVMPVDSLK